MTWVEAIPGVVLMFACCSLAVFSCNMHPRTQYRGWLDARLPISHNDETNDPLKRWADRDRRLVMFKNEVDWVHPLWKPQKEAVAWLESFRQQQTEEQESC